jgi:ADP-heptose:LPS heptosyltransferase
MARFHHDPGARPLKVIERAARATVTRLLGVMRAPRRVLRPDDAPSLRPDARVVFLRQDRIGDALIVSPLVHAVRAAWPQARLEMVLSPNNVAAHPAFVGAVNASHVYRKGLRGLGHIVSTLRQSRIDLIVDCLDNASTTSALLVTLSGARRALGFDTEHRGVYTHVVPVPDKASVHISDRIRTLAAGFGLDPTSVDMRPRYPIEDAAVMAARRRVFGEGPPSLVIGLNISGSSGVRSVREDRAIAILSAIMPATPDIRWLVFGAPYHAAEVIRVAAATGAHAVPASSDFHAYASALRLVHGLVTPDTSAVHLAAAWGIPSCVLFSQPDPQLHLWTPYDTPCESIVTQSRDLADIPVADIIHGVSRLVDRVRRTIDAPLPVLDQVGGADHLRS